MTSSVSSISYFSFVVRFVVVFRLSAAEMNFVTLSETLKRHSSFSVTLSLSEMWCFVRLVVVVVVVYRSSSSSSSVDDRRKKNCHLIKVYGTGKIFLET